MTFYEFNFECVDLSSHKNEITAKNRLMGFCMIKRKHDGCSIVCSFSFLFLSFFLLFSIHKSDTRAKNGFNSNSTPSKKKID